MAEATKSVLFIDYDSIHRSLEIGHGTAAERLAPRVAAWVAAIESGKIFGKKSGGARRRVLMRRCYADPSLLGGERSSFLSNGFQVVDCPPVEGSEGTSAPIHMVLDTIDALEHPAGYEEFILLSAETDLSPVLIRLRAHNRGTAIYAKSATAESYKAIADAMIDEEHLAAIVLSDEPPAEDAPAPPLAERSHVEALARKIAGATSVPLFAPRTFAELFRHLVDEISENGYHFQTTAENVATRMAEAGRNVTRRQVVFVVKGLALKGHVFSTSDTPERLAEVFREQVLYLTDNAGLELDKTERSVLGSWIVGRVAAGSTGSEAVEIEATAPPELVEEQPPAKPSGKSGNERPSRSSRKKQSRSPDRIKADAAPPAARESARPAESGPETKPGGRAAEAAEPDSKPAAYPTIATRPPAPQVRPTPPPVRPPSATIRPPPGARPASPLSAAPGTRPAANSPMRTPPVSRPAIRPPPSETEKEKVESSILAAIAQAVDVLVEDGETKNGARPNGPRDKAPETADSSAEGMPPAPGADEAPGGDDIGDEIQRIIASYNRKRDRNA